MRENQVWMDRAINTMGAISRKGVKLWLENSQLRYKAPKGALTAEEIDELRLYKDQIVSILEGAAASEAAEPRRISRLRLERAPLTFTQLARWNLFELGVRHSSSMISSALRLRGALNIDVLRKSVAELVLRHDALRTRIPIRDGIPVQEIAAPGDDFEMKVDDLTGITEISCELEIERLTKRHVEPIDVAAGPLFRARLLIIRDDECVLLLTMDHMISDGASLRILLRELPTAYMQIEKTGKAHLPAIPLQFTDYAVWQRDAHESWVRRHGSYWEKHLKGCQRLKFHPDHNLSAETQRGWANVPFRLGRELKSELREWCRLNRTTLAMSVFTAYVALVLRWCNASEAIFLYEIDGRDNPTIRGTIGYFAFPLYLRVRTVESDSFADLLDRVTDEYCNAHHHADYCYLEAQVPMPEFARNTIFNWVGRSFESDVVDLGESSIEFSLIPPETKTIDNSPEIDTEPVVVLFETEHEIEGLISVPLSRFSINTVERFARSIPICVNELLREPGQRVRDVRLL